MAPEVITQQILCLKSEILMLGDLQQNQILMIKYLGLFFRRPFQRVMVS